MSQGKDYNKLGLKLRKGIHILFKILFSFKSEAYNVLWLKFLQLLLAPIDYIFYIIERLSIKKNENQEIPIIFIVGIQRTGSTLISQFVEKVFHFFPIGNFNSIFKRSSYYLHKWISRFYTKSNKSYRNFYGISKGFFSIGDCYELWDRWFGENHYILPEKIDDKRKQNLICNFSNLFIAYKKPILTKNNRNSLLIPLFNDTFQNAFFVVVKRDPLAVIRSTLKASKDFFGTDDLLWGLYPNHDFETNNYENSIEAATVQFLMLDKILTEQVKKLASDSYLVVDYDEFCENPEKFRNQLENKLNSKWDFTIDRTFEENKSFQTSKRLENSNLDIQINKYLYKWKDKI
ncbi:MAG: hypothetical protein C0597_00995 [Marinilabiliales bacterium]|nr:MAG: hypothetical protein C0597_00995 [Marinilabiliales bacterium]